MSVHDSEVGLEVPGLRASVLKSQLRTDTAPADREGLPAPT